MSGKTPRTIGPYEILRILDAGGMGKVYLAKEREGVAAGRLVVVKTMRTEFERAPEHIASFHREARVLAHLRHPNIVQLYDAGRVGHRLYMAMEYLEGLDVAKVLRLCAAQSHAVPLAVIAHVATQVALALDAAHAYEIEPGKPAGLVHRDLSPHNIFLLYSGSVKLLDFGLARAYGEVGTTRTGMVKGKFRYLAPEQARGEPLDARVDIFTLGLVLHEMITGRRAYEQHGDVDVLRAAMAGEFPRLSEMGLDVPPALVDVIERASAIERDDRYPSALALAEDLRAAAAEAGLADDPLTLRSFMAEIRVMAERDPPAPHAETDDSEDGDEADFGARPSMSYLRESSLSLVEDPLPAAPPIVRGAPPPPSRSRSRMVALLASAAATILLLTTLLLLRRGPHEEHASAAVPAAASAAPPAASVVAAPSASATASASADPPKAPPPAAATIAAPPSKPVAPGSRRVIKPKRGVGTGVVADYP